MKERLKHLKNLQAELDWYSKHAAKIFSSNSAIHKHITQVEIAVLAELNAITRER